MHAHRLVGLLAVAHALGAGCSADDAEVSEPDPAAALDGRTFVVESVTDAGVEQDLVEGTEIAFTFDGGTVRVTGGCNTISGTYVVDGAAVLVVDELETTDIGCAPELMMQDSLMSAILFEGPALAIEGDRLTFTEGSWKTVLVER